jgi:hypothetical protein
MYVAAGTSDFGETNRLMLSVPSLFEYEGSWRYSMFDGHHFGIAAEPFEDGMVYKLLRKRKHEPKNVLWWI